MSIAENETQGSLSSILPAEKLNIHSDASRVAIPASSTSAGPTIDVVRDGDVIQAINITCRCGERIRLTCTYE